MITSQFLSINIIKKEKYTGSYKGMRYQMAKISDETFQSTIYPEPFCFECTPDDKKQSAVFPLSEEGLASSIAWLNEEYEKNPSRWNEASCH